MRTIVVFSPPHFEDERLTQKSRLLNGAIWFMIASSVLLTVPSILFAPREAPLYLGIVGLIAFLFFARWLMFRGDLTAALWMVLTPIAAVLAFALAIDGLASPAAATFLLLAAIAGALDGVRGAVVAGLLGAVLITLAAIAESLGVVSYHQEIPVWSRLLVLNLQLLGTSAFMGWLAVERRKTAERISERERVEEELREQLQRALRLESLGRLAGGIAHDFNNLLAVILASTELAAGEEDRGKFDLVYESVEQGQALTRELLLFAREEHEEAEPVDLAEAIERATRLARTSSAKTIQIESSIEPNLPLVLASSARIDRVINNLVRNAVEAIEAREAGGTVRVTAETAGPLVRVTVQDDGVGMSAEVIDRAFDPFFTTKGGKRGWGLGLAAVHMIVDGLGGSVSITSTEGSGTELVVELTALDVSTPQRRPRPESTLAFGETSSDVSLRVLLVEDNLRVQRATALLLERRGFEVVVADCGPSALKLLGEQSFDVVVSDVSMTPMTGPEMLASMRAAADETPTLFMSGYSGGAVEELDAPMLPKPFTGVELESAVHRLLDLQGK